MISEDNARYLVVLVFALVLTAAGSMLSAEGLTGYAIYNVSNGTIIFECGNIVEPGTYTLNQSISTNSNCFDILANNVTLDFNGYNITGQLGGYGIYSKGYNYTKIKNAHIYQFPAGGIYLENAYGSEITGGYIFNNSGDGIKIVSGNNSKILNNTIINNTGLYGISLWKNSDNAEIKNNIIMRNTFNIGILTSSSNVTMVNNTLRYSQRGIAPGENTTIENNTFESNECGVSLNLKGITLISNTFINNRAFYCFMTENFTSTANTLKNSLVPVFDFVSTGQNADIYQNISFNLTMRYLNRTKCPYCYYNITIYPSGTNLSTSVSEENITGNFIPTKIGIYSLRINITDENNNSVIKTYKYYVNISNEKVVDYSISKSLTGHGQGFNPSGSDTGSMIYTIPNSDENISCASWVQASPDVLPREEALGVIKSMNVSIYYSHNGTERKWIGIEQYTKYGETKDKNITINSTDHEKVFGSFKFDINWSMDYIWSWYWISLKMDAYNPTAPYGLPIIFSGNINISSVNITYSYSNTPAIRGISNEDVEILSANMDNNESTTANITLEGTGNTTIIIEMPVKEPPYAILFDGISCNNNNNCSINSILNGIVNLTVSLGSEHNISIFNDTTLPAITAHNLTSYYGNEINVQFNGTDNYQVDSFSINDTTNFTINHTGYFQNASLPWGNVIYWIKLTLNDTANNTAEDIIFINMTQPTATTTANPDQPPARVGEATTTSETSENKNESIVTTTLEDESIENELGISSETNTNGEPFNLDLNKHFYFILPAILVIIIAIAIICKVYKYKINAKLSGFRRHITD